MSDSTSSFSSESDATASSEDISTSSEEDVQDANPAAAAVRSPLRRRVQLFPKVVDEAILFYAFNGHPSAMSTASGESRHQFPKFLFSRRTNNKEECDKTVLERIVMHESALALVQKGMDSNPAWSLCLPRQRVPKCRTLFSSCRPKTVKNGSGPTPWANVNAETRAFAHSLGQLGRVAAFVRHTQITFVSPSSSHHVKHNAFLAVSYKDGRPSEFGRLHSAHTFELRDDDTSLSFFTMIRHIFRPEESSHLETIYKRENPQHLLHVHFDSVVEVEDFLTVDGAAGREGSRIVRQPTMFEPVRMVCP